MVAANYFELGRVLELDWLRDAITRLPRDNRWQALTRSALRDDLYRLHRELTASAWPARPAAKRSTPSTGWPAKAANWSLPANAERTAGYDTLDLAMLSAGMREVGKPPDALIYS